MRLGRGVTPGHGQEADAERADETGHREAARQRERGDAEREDEVHGRLLDEEILKECLEREPLADEAVQRRKRRGGDGPAQEARRGPGHALDEAAERFHVARAGGVDDGAGAEKEQGLEGGVVDGVIERRRQADHRQGRQPSRVVENAGAEADQDDPHVLDRREGEHAFEIAVDDGRQHANHR